MGWAGGHRTPSSHWCPFRFVLLCNQTQGVTITVCSCTPASLMPPSKEKDPITFMLPGESLWEKENKAEACLHTGLTDPRPLMPCSELNPSAPAKLSPPDLELCHGAPHSCKTPSSPMGSAVPVGWCRGCSTLGIKGHGCCVRVRLPQPGDPAVNLFVSFLYRILLPKKEN